MKTISGFSSDPPDPPAVSIIIPCYNGAAYVEKTLEHVFRQTRPAVEVIFVDDGSTDDSATRANRFPVHLIANEGNRGLSYSRNRAAHLAAGEILFFLDVDAFPAPDLVARLEKEFADPGVAAAGGQGLEVNLQNLYDRFRRAFFSQGLGSRRRENARVLFGLCSAYRKDRFLALGGFDPAFRTNGEDFDLAFRLRAAGGRIVYEPSLQVFHHRHDERDSFLRMVYRWYYWGMEACRKNSRPFRLGFLAKALLDLPVHLFFALRQPECREACRTAMAIAARRLAAWRDRCRGREPAV